MPVHSHTINANSGLGTTSSPTNNVPANTGVFDKEYATTSNAVMATTGSAGGNVPLDNMKPYAPVYYVIALQGIFPSRN
jgi:microcystin-dependent protein